MSDVNRAPELASMPEPQFDSVGAGISSETDEVLKSKREADEAVSALPKDTQLIVQKFISVLARNILGQSTYPSGDEFEIRADNVFYRKQLGEINESGFLNPHEFPPKKIT